MVISGTKYKTDCSVENFMPADKFTHGNTNVAHFEDRFTRCQHQQCCFPCCPKQQTKAGQYKSSIRRHKYMIFIIFVFAEELHSLLAQLACMTEVHSRMYRAKDITHQPQASIFEFLSCKFVSVFIIHNTTPALTQAKHCSGYTPFHTQQAELGRLEELLVLLAFVSKKQCVA